MGNRDTTGGSGHPTLAKVVGHQIEVARKDLGSSQVELGQRLAPWLGGRGWTKPVVSKVETGGREVSASELIALAAVLDRPVAYFLVPESDSAVQLPGKPVETGELLEIVHGVPTEGQDVDLAAVRGLAKDEGIALDAVRQRLSEALEAVDLARVRADGLVEHLNAEWPEVIEMRKRTQRVLRDHKEGSK